MIHELYVAVVNVQNANRTSLIPSARSPSPPVPLDGNWGTLAPGLGSIVAIPGTFLNAFFDSSDLLIVEFTFSTNHAESSVVNKAQLDRIFENLPGRKSGWSYTGVWGRQLGKDCGPAQPFKCRQHLNISFDDLQLPFQESEPRVGNFTLRFNNNTVSGSDLLGVHIGSDFSMTLPSNVLTGSWGARAGPTIVSFFSTSGPQADCVLGVGDKLFVAFSEPTNGPEVFPPMSSYFDAFALFNFSVPVAKQLGARWINNDVVCELTIIVPVASVSGQPVVSIKPSSGLKSRDRMSLDSQGSSPPLTGSFSSFSEPYISGLTAFDPNNRDGVFSNGDIIEIRFSIPVITPVPSSLSRSQVNSLVNFTESLGTDYSATWASASTLSITILDARGAGPPKVFRSRAMLLVGLRSAIQPACGPGSFGYWSSAVLSGSFGNQQGPCITSITASDPTDADVVYGIGDRFSLTFSDATSTPDVSTPELVAGLFDFSQPPGKLTGNWTGFDKLLLTVVSGPTSGIAPIIGAFTVVIASPLLVDRSRVMAPCTSSSPPLGGNWGMSPGPFIVLFVASDSTNRDSVYGVGDTIRIEFSEPIRITNSGPHSRQQVDALFTFSQALGTDYTGVWEAPQAFIVTVVNATGAFAPQIGVLVARTRVNMIYPAVRSSLAADSVSGPLSGTWGSGPLCLAQTSCSTCTSLYYCNWCQASRTCMTDVVFDKSSAGLTCNVTCDACWTTSSNVGAFYCEQNPSCKWCSQGCSTRTSGNSSCPAIPVISVTVGATILREGSSSLSVTTLTVTLDTKPTELVRVPLSVDGPVSQVLLDKVNLFFDPNDWASPRVVRLSVIDDEFAEPDISLSVVAGPAIASSPLYIGLSSRSPILVVKDDDIAGVSIDSSNVPSTGLVEGDFAQIFVRFSSRPTASVQITARYSNRISMPPLGIFSFDPVQGEVRKPLQWLLSAIDNHVVDANETSNVTFTSTSADPDFHKLLFTGFSVSVIDNDVAEIRVASIIGADNQSNATSEAGDSVKVIVTLTSIPARDVSIKFVSLDISEGQVQEPSTLIFLGGSATSWSSPHTILVQGIDDWDVDGDVSYFVKALPAVSGDNAYQGQSLVGGDVKLTNLDNDTATFRVSSTRNTTWENGTDPLHISVSLAAHPSSTVSLNVTALPCALVSIATGILSGELSLEFVPGRWSSPVSLTIVAVDNDFSDGDRSCDLIFGPASSADASFQNVSLKWPFKILEDDFPGFKLAPGTVSISEIDPNPHTMQLYLRSRPRSAVEFTVLSGAPGRLSTTVPASVQGVTRVDPTDWKMIAANVTVQSVDNDLIDGNAVALLNVQSLSLDPNFRGQFVVGPIMIVDDDIAVVQLSLVGPGRTYENGTGTSIAVTLGARPTSTVQVSFVIANIVASDRAEGRLGSDFPLIFSPLNFRQAQTLSVFGVDDEVADGDVLYWVMVANITSADQNYGNSSSGTRLQLVNTDDDSTGLILNLPGNLVIHDPPFSGTLYYGPAPLLLPTSLAFLVQLASQPRTSVYFSLSSSVPARAVVAPTAIIFTPQSWSVKQEIVVSAIDDDAPAGDSRVRVTLLVAPQSDPRFRGLTQSVLVTVIDDDLPGVRLAARRPLLRLNGEVTELKFALLSSPLARVTVTVQFPSELKNAAAFNQSFVFTDGDWDTARTLTITGIPDMVDSDARDVFVFFSCGAPSFFFERRPLPVLVLDNAMISSIVTESSGLPLSSNPLILSESDVRSRSVSVRLTSKPSGDVVLPIEIWTPTVRGASEVQITSATALRFTASDLGALWNVPQTFGVTLLDDTVFSGPRTARLVIGPAVSSDLKYSGAFSGAFDISLVDNDVTAVIPVIPGYVSLASNALNSTVSSAPGSLTAILAAPSLFTLRDALPVVSFRLASSPLSPVTVSAYLDLSSVSESLPAVVDPTARNDVISVPFDKITWQISQPFAISYSNSTSSSSGAGQISSATAARSFRTSETVALQASFVTAVTSSSDPLFDKMNVQVPGVLVPQGATPGRLLVLGAGIGREGDSGWSSCILLALSSWPASAPTSVPLTLALSLVPAEKFEPEATTVVIPFSSWKSVRRIRLRGLDNYIVDGDVVVTATINAGPQTPLLFASTSFTVMDDDALGLRVISPPPEVVTNEAGVPGFIIFSLASQPIGNVTIEASTNLPSEAKVAVPGRFYFTPLSWAQAQTVTVIGQRDENPLDDSVTFAVMLRTLPESSDAQYRSFSGKDIPARNLNVVWPTILSVEPLRKSWIFRGNETVLVLGKGIQPGATLSIVTAGFISSPTKFYTLTNTAEVLVVAVQADAFYNETSSSPATLRLTNPDHGSVTYTVCAPAGCPVSPSTTVSTAPDKNILLLAEITTGVSVFLFVTVVAAIVLMRWHSKFQNQTPAVNPPPNGLPGRIPPPAVLPPHPSPGASMRTPAPGPAHGFVTPGPAHGYVTHGPVYAGGATPALGGDINITNNVFAGDANAPRKAKRTQEEEGSLNPNTTWSIRRELFKNPNANGIES